MIKVLFVCHLMVNLLRLTEQKQFLIKKKLQLAGNAKEDSKINSKIRRRDS